MPLIRTGNRIVLNTHAADRIFPVRDLLMMPCVMIHSTMSMPHGRVLIMTAIIAMIVTTMVMAAAATSTSTAAPHNQENNSANYYNPH